MDKKQEHVLTEKIRLLYLNSLAPAMLSGMAAVFLVAALWRSANHQHLLIWLTVTITLAIIRITLLLSFRRKNPKGKAILAWEKPFSISLFSVFLVWSIGILMVIPPQNLYAIFIVSTFSIGLATGAISWYGYIRYVQITSLCIALIPIITALLTYGLAETLWVGTAACFLFLSCLASGQTFQKTLNGNLELAYDLNESMKNAEVLARTDELTGLNNRRAFFDTAPNLLRQCRKKELPATLVMFDVDHFKKINDMHGHAGGDAALQHVASLLKANLRRSDISCRFGGEEFAVLLPNTTLEEAHIAAEKLRALIEDEPATFSRNTRIALTASFGVSDTGETIDEILNHADNAMYVAKEAGRNKVNVYVPKRPSKDDKRRSKFKSDKSTKLRESL